MAVEVTGDSARGSEWAFARLVVDGDRIIQADAPGMARPLGGLTLLEAAAVPGDTLAADAVANAVAEVFHAAPDTGRIAVAMSGGVDSAVALHRAGHNAVGVTLRLWLDPHGPGAERACCSPRPSSPRARPAMRSAFRTSPSTSESTFAPPSSARSSTATHAGRRRTRAAAATARSASTPCWPSPSAPARGASGQAIAHESSSAAGCGWSLAAPIRPRTSPTCSRPCTALLERVEFPLGGQTKADTRREAAAAGLAAAGRAESQEACFLAGGDYRTFLERAGLAAAPGVIVDEDGKRLGGDGIWRFTPGQRRASSVAAAEPLYALRADAASATRRRSERLSRRARWTSKA